MDRGFVCGSVGGFTEYSLVSILYRSTTRSKNIRSTQAKAKQYLLFQIFIFIIKKVINYIKQNINVMTIETQRKPIQKCIMRIFYNSLVTGLSAKYNSFVSVQPCDFHRQRVSTATCICYCFLNFAPKILNSTLQKFCV